MSRIEIAFRKYYIPKLRKIGHHKVGIIKTIFVGKGSIHSSEIGLYSFLSDSNEKNLILGMAGILDTCVVFCDHESQIAYLEFS